MNSIRKPLSFSPKRPAGRSAHLSRRSIGPEPEPEPDRNNERANERTNRTRKRRPATTTGDDDARVDEDTSTKLDDESESRCGPLSALTDTRAPPPPTPTRGGRTRGGATRARAAREGPSPSGAGISARARVFVRSPTSRFQHLIASPFN